MTPSPKPADYVSELEVLRTLATAEVDSAGDLERNLARIYHEIIERDLRAYTGADFKPYAPILMEEMFLISATLRSRIGEWHRAGLLTRPTEAALRDALRALRYAIDMLGELYADFPAPANAPTSMRAFREYAYNTFVHPRFDTGQNLDFQSGDVLVVRGTQHNSAAIARIGTMDSQFSHTSIIHFDEEGNGFVVEALIEDGSVINPLAKALESNLARALLLRYPDQELATRASKLIFDYVARSRQSGHKPILYDFTMELSGSDRLFCSKLVRLAYAEASEGYLMMPTFTTFFDQRKKPFFKRLGVTATETFAPGDLEIEPKFELVAEWHNYEQTSRARLQDLIMSKLFEWMELRGWRFEEDVIVALIARLGRLSTYMSKTVQDVIASQFGRIPPHMPRRTIATIIMLNRTADPLLKELEHRERLSVTATGRPLHPHEVLEYLEQVRRTSGGQVGYLRAPPRRPRRSWFSIRT